MDFFKIIVVLCTLSIISIALTYFAFTKLNKIKSVYESLKEEFSGLDEKEAQRIDIDERYFSLQQRYRNQLGELKNNQKLLAEFNVGIGSVDSILYEREVNANELEKIEQKLVTVKSELKYLVSDKEACICTLGDNLVVNGKKSEAKKLINREIKLRLRCIDNEVKSSIAVADWNNINRLVNRLKRTFDDINDRGEIVETFIQRKYLTLKIKELTLSYEIQQLKVDIKEAEREEKQFIREAEREEVKIKAAVEKAKKERKLMEKLVAKELAKLANATEEQRQLLAMHQEELAALKDREKRAISLAQQTRAGYVYIITNEASFGPDMVKIGMTRRVDPYDRVNELGDASVPDTFDVQAFFYCDDAPSLESALHKHFERARINRVNRRKEFFNIPVETAIKAVEEQSIVTTRTV